MTVSFSQTFYVILYSLTKITIATQLVHVTMFFFHHHDNIDLAGCVVLHWQTASTLPHIYSARLSIRHCV